MCVFDDNEKYLVKPKCLKLTFYVLISIFIGFINLLYFSDIKQLYGIIVSLTNSYESSIGKLASIVLIEIKITIIAVIVSSFSIIFFLRNSPFVYAVEQKGKKIVISNLNGKVIAELELGQDARKVMLFHLKTIGFKLPTFGRKKYIYINKKISEFKVPEEYD